MRRILPDRRRPRRAANLIGPGDAGYLEREMARDQLVRHQSRFVAAGE
jgi:hypothetical protein